MGGSLINYFVRLMDAREGWAPLIIETSCWIHVSNPIILWMAMRDNLWNIRSCWSKRRRSIIIRILQIYILSGSSTILILLWLIFWAAAPKYRCETIGYKPIILISLLIISCIVVILIFCLMLHFLYFQNFNYRWLFYNSIITFL